MNQDIFKGIADPLRRKIIDLLARSPLNINQINEYFPEVTRQAISKHLGILEDCGVVKIYQAGRERYGYLHTKAFDELNQWLQQYTLMENTLPNDYEVLLKKTDFEAGKPLPHAVMLQAMLSKDSQFDGAFYIAVKTTGIFCKPSCRAKPKPENVLFYASKEEAQKNGYRSCKVCKP